MSDDAGVSSAQRGGRPDEKAKLVPDAEAPSDGSGETAGEDGSSRSAFGVLKKRSEKSLERFIITFVVVNLILAVRLQQPRQEPHHVGGSRSAHFCRVPAL